MPHLGSDGFKPSLSLIDLTMIGFGSIFGSGWLFAAAHVADMAGPASVIAWVFGGIAVFLIGLVYCELGASLPLAGGVVRYPEQSHGQVAGFLAGLVTTIAFTSLISIEIVAARQYAGAWIPGLTANTAGDPTLLGWLLQTLTLFALFIINYRGIKTFALFNNVITLFKFLVPSLVIFLLFRHFNPSNFTQFSFAPHGTNGIEEAVSTGGVIFAYLGITPILSVASEAKNPQRTIPLSLIASVTLSTVVYVLLQMAFVGSLSPALITHGWNNISSHLPLPFYDIAIALGLTALGYFVVTDAVLSPSGTGNIYMSSTARVIYAWAKGGTFFAPFTRVNACSGVPDKALFLTFLLSIFWTLPFPSWQALISVVSSALMLSYALAPLSAASLRKTHPSMTRPFYLKGFALLCPLSFIVSTLIILWTGWQTLRWLMIVLFILTAAFMLISTLSPKSTMTLRQNLYHAGWLPVYFLGLATLSYLGPFGGHHLLSSLTTHSLTALGAFVIYTWAQRVGLRPTITQ